MDAFELLKTDHKKVADLFDRLEAASGKPKLDVFKQLKSELELHTHIEEKISYPATEKPEETHVKTLEAYEEHKVVKAGYMSQIRPRYAAPINRIGLILIILIMLPGCVVVGGYNPERGWFLWPGTIVIFLVGAVLLLLFRRRR
jgi:hypothetical protein